MAETVSRAAPGPNALLAVLAPVRGRLVIALIAGAFASTLFVAGLLMVGLAVDQLLNGAGGSRVAMLLGAAAISGVLAFALRKHAFDRSHYASFDLETVLRRDLAEHLGTVPLGEVQRLGAGPLKKVLQDDVRALHGAVADAVPMIGTGLAQPVAALIAMAVLDWRLLLTSLVVVPAAALGAALVSRDYAVQRKAYDAANEEVNSAVVEFVQGMPVVRTFDDGSTSFGRFAGAVDRFTAATRRWQDQTRWAGVITRLLLTPAPTLIALLAVGIWLIGRDDLGVGTLVCALLIGTLAIDAVVPLMYLSDMITQSRAAAIRIRDIHAIAPLAEPEQPQRPRDGSIRFSGVDFSYDRPGDRPSGRLALSGVDIDVPAGTVCALVGPSGSGKSTVARLIPRFWDVTAGTVFVGGADVRQIASEDLLTHVGLVFQETFLVDDTIAENIRLARPEASDEQVRAAARAAQADEFIRTALPLGYDTPVGERGGLLSGGQRQRITIARALLADPPVIILDEATAFADPENEAAIQDALAELTRGRTVIVIAHRLSTIRDADQIVVLDGGRVAETGTHDSLVGSGGRYARMWAEYERARSWGLSGARADERAEVIS